MFEQITISLARLAARWDRTPGEVLEHAQHLGIALYFTFDGLAFDKDDVWHRFAGDSKQKAELARLALAIESVEGRILRAQRGELTPWEDVPSGGVAELRAAVETMRHQVRIIDDILERRDIERRQLELGYLRAGPGTLKDIAEKGVIPFPRWAFHPGSGIRGAIVRDKRGSPAFEWSGRLMCLEPRCEDDPHWKSTITADSLFASMAEVKAIEAANSDIADSTAAPDATAITSKLSAAPADQSTWTVRKPERFQGYGKPLYDALKTASAAGLPRPTPRDILDTFRATRPPEIIGVMPDGLQYYDGEGNSKTADLRAIKKAIDRLTQQVPDSAE